MKRVVLLKDSDGAGGITVFDKSMGKWRVAGTATFTFPVFAPKTRATSISQLVAEADKDQITDTLRGYRPSTCLKEGVPQDAEPVAATHVSMVEFKRRTCQISWYQDWRVLGGIGGGLALLVGGVAIARR